LGANWLMWLDGKLVPLNNCLTNLQFATKWCFLCQMWRLFPSISTIRIYYRNVLDFLHQSRTILNLHRSTDCIKTMVRPLWRDVLSFYDTPLSHAIHHICCVT
jgi:hypothetical protein